MRHIASGKCTVGQLGRSAVCDHVDVRGPTGVVARENALEAGYSVLIGLGNSSQEGAVDVGQIRLIAVSGADDTRVDTSSVATVAETLSGGLTNSGEKGRTYCQRSQYRLAMGSQVLMSMNWPSMVTETPGWSSTRSSRINSPRTSFQSLSSCQAMDMR